MPNVTSYKQGTPSWVDLATSDEKAAVKFYSQVFGWQDDPQPMGPGEFYHMQKLKGREAAAIAKQRPEDAKMGIPPHWNTYISVTDADAATKRAVGAGGKVLMEPFDVFEAGRMSVIADPTGGVVGLWQAKQMPGAGIAREPGSVAWNELLTNDPPKAAAFFEKVLGVKAATMPMPDGGTYTLLKVDGQDVAGVFKITPQMGPIPPSWAVYFSVADTDATLKKVTSLGGKQLMPAMDSAWGRFAMVTDPQGAAFGLLGPTPKK